jgi:hypothetical protein
VLDTPHGALSESRRKNTSIRVSTQKESDMGLMDKVKQSAETALNKA